MKGNPSRGRQTAVIVTLIVLSLLVTTCGPSAPEGKVFKLGILGPFTGPAARTGEEIKNSYTMAFEAIDYKIGDYTIELVLIDSESDPAKATTAYEEAITRNKMQAGSLACCAA